MEQDFDAKITELETEVRDVKKVLASLIMALGISITKKDGQMILDIVRPTPERAGFLSQIMHNLIVLNEKANDQRIVVPK